MAKFEQFLQKNRIINKIKILPLVRNMKIFSEIFLYEKFMKIKKYIFSFLFRNNERKKKIFVSHKNQGKKKKKK